MCILHFSVIGSQILKEETLILIPLIRKCMEENYSHLCERSFQRFPPAFIFPFPIYYTNGLFIKDFSYGFSICTSAPF